MIEDYTYLADGTLNMRFTYTYDEAGNPASNQRYSPKGQLLKTIDYTFNEQGYMATQTERDADGQVLKSTRFTYDWDATGNWTRKVTFEEGNPAELVEREIRFCSLPGPGEVSGENEKKGCGFKGGIEFRVPQARRDFLLRRSPSGSSCRWHPNHR